MSDSDVFRDNPSVLDRLEKWVVWVEKELANKKATVEMQKNGQCHDQHQKSA